MRIIESSFQIVKPASLEEGIESLRLIERFARISHRSEDRQTEDSWRRFIEAVILQHGDWSVVEHASASVIFRVDRGIALEMVRHRLFSFTMESTRFCNYAKKGEMEFIQPSETDDTGSIFITREGQARQFWEAHMRDCENKYFAILNTGRSPQIARSVLPNSLASSIAMTGNLRSFRWFFLARTSRECHPDMLRVTLPLLEAFKERIPLLYDDVESQQKQSISMSKIH